MTTVSIKGVNTTFQCMCYNRLELNSLNKSNTPFYIYDYGKRALIGSIINFLPDINIIFACIPQNSTKSDIEALLSHVDAMPGTNVLIMNTVPFGSAKRVTKKYINSTLKIMAELNCVNLYPLHSETTPAFILFIYANQAAYTVLNLKELEDKITAMNYDFATLPASVYGELKEATNG